MKAGLPVMALALSLLALVLSLAWNPSRPLARAACRLGVHRWNYTGNAYTFAPATIRCERCGCRYSRRGDLR